MFIVCHMGSPLRSFRTRDAAMKYVMARTMGSMGDYEILDKSDFTV
jgi:hypothetical protein